MKSLSAIASIFALLFLSGNLRAVVTVGSEAKLTYQTVDGKTVNIEDLRGKIVVVDFWATWCGPCMAAAPKIVALNQKYHAQGLQMLGISLDSNKDEMLSTAKSKGFDWPEYFDGQVWKNKVFAQWGGNFIPFTVVVDPNGKVVFADNPEPGLADAIEKTFKATPPRLIDPSVVTAAGKTLEQIEGKIAEKDAKAAMKLLSRLDAVVRTDPDVAERLKKVEASLQEIGEKLLAEVDPLLVKKEYKEAILHLREISQNLSGLPIAASAKKKLKELTSNPEVKAALADAEKSERQAERNAKAADALLVAQKLEADKKDQRAYLQYKQIARQYSGADAATLASDRVKAYETAHPDWVQKANESEVGSKAKAALSMAASYKEAGNVEKARAKYQSVIENFPGTSYAKTAKEELEKMN